MLSKQMHTEKQMQINRKLFFHSKMWIETILLTLSSLVAVDRGQMWKCTEFYRLKKMDI